MADVFLSAIFPYQMQEMANEHVDFRLFELVPPRRGKLSALPAAVGFVCSC
ncbi:hypothetical protein [Streptomyces bacillaris]|uniref:hypothetical protein n=1 Tax=Streptomyces bacillaris TaxID=68179 RepID=UPI00382A7DE9